MPDCGVHYLWFAFVCILIRSPPPPGLPPRPPVCTPPWGPDTWSGAKLRAPSYLVLARVNALGIPFSRPGPLAPVPTIGTSLLQQADSVYNGQAVSTWGRQCLQTVDRRAPMHG